MTVTSPEVSDAAERTVGPVLNVPPAVMPAGVDMLAGSARVRLPAAPAQVSQWVLRLDGGSPTYLNVAATEHYFNNLVAGTRYTVTLAACDCPSVGEQSTVAFTQLARPEAPAYTTAPRGFTVTLPSPAAGQTGWVTVIDGVEKEVPLATTAVSVTDQSTGGHSFGLRAVSSIARTNATFVYPQVP